MQHPSSVPPFLLALCAVLSACGANVRGEADCSVASVDSGPTLDGAVAWESAPPVDCAPVRVEAAPVSGIVWVPCSDAPACDETEDAGVQSDGKALRLVVVREVGEARWIVITSLEGSVVLTTRESSSCGRSSVILGPLGVAVVRNDPPAIHAAAWGSTGPMRVFALGGMGQTVYVGARSFFPVFADPPDFLVTAVDGATGVTTKVGTFPLFGGPVGVADDLLVRKGDQMALLTTAGLEPLVGAPPAPARFAVDRPRAEILAVEGKWAVGRFDVFRVSPSGSVPVGWMAVPKDGGDSESWFRANDGVLALSVGGAREVLRTGDGQRLRAAFPYVAGGRLGDLTLYEDLAHVDATWLLTRKSGHLRRRRLTTLEVLP